MTESVLLLRLAQVIKICGLKKSSIYDRMKKGTFPKSVRLGPKSVAWRSDELEKWIDELPRAVP